MFDIDKMIEDHAEQQRWSAASDARRFMEIGRLAPAFIKAMGEAFDVVQLVNSPRAELYSWGCNGGGPYVTYSLAASEAVADTRKIAHEMVTRGWLFTTEEDTNHLRVIFAFTKPSQNLRGYLYVSISESEHCKLVVEREEEVPATTRKIYKIQCDERPGVDATPLELTQQPMPDGDEEQSRTDGDVGSDKGVPF